MFTLCDSFFFLLVLLYFIKYPLILSTLSVPFAGASKTLPLVINSTSQWLLFANKINANDSNFNSNKFFLLANDLDFANNSINPVGSSSSGFKGTLYGNKHSIKKAKLNAVNHPSNSSISISGLFGKLNTASIYDIKIDSSCTYSYNLNRPTSAGTVAALATNATLVNVSSYANITVNNSGVTTGHIRIAVAGLVGEAVGNGYIRFYKSIYQGTVSEVAGNGAPKDSAGNAITYTDNNIHISGFIGYKEAGITELTATQSVVNATFNATHGGINLGTLWGGGIFGNKLTINITDLIAISKYNATGTLYSADIRNLFSYNTAGTTNPNSLIKNIYYYNDTATPGYLCCNGNNDALTTAQQQNIVTNKTLTNATATLGNATVVATSAEVLAKANTNSSLTQYYTINSSSGTITNKLNSVGNIGLHRARQSAFFYLSLLQIFYM